MADPIYRIHPAIGIARVGNADRNTFFVGPEVPGLGPRGDTTVGTLVPDFKSGGLIKPQAARFRIWEYVDDGKGNWVPSREINLDEKDCVSLVWTAHLANRKGSFFEFAYLAGLERPAAKRRNDTQNERRKLEIDPLPRTISGRKAKPVEFRKGKSSNPAKELWPLPAPSPVLDYLGELRTDDAGRLLVIGGKGLGYNQGGTPLGADPFNNDKWFDDVSDGPVQATLTLKRGGKNKVVKVEPAWVLCGPPDFAPTLTNQVTLYDVLYDMAAREMTVPLKEGLFSTVLKPLRDINAEFKANGGPKLTTFQPSFDDDIFPILRRAQETVFTFAALAGSHGTLKGYGTLGDSSAGAKPARQAVFNRLRAPGVVGVGGAANMPLLHGDAYGQVAHARFGLTVTETQYAMLKRWVDGQFVKSAGTFPPLRPAWMAAVSPHGLDRAALENCVGGALGPGIEVGWQIRHTKLYASPFRIDHSATSQYLGDSKPIRAGHFSRQMALPWHTDFLACTLQDGRGWWPAQRPDIVYKTKADFDKAPRVNEPWARDGPGTWPSGPGLPTGEEFIAHYHKLGFVREGPAFHHLEQERNASVP
ncbi:MAG: LodA/GoxA family CTQ-dependent oxidase [Pseudomonadota bacterium]